MMLQWSREAPLEPPSGHNPVSSPSYSHPQSAFPIRMLAASVILSVCLSVCLPACLPACLSVSVCVPAGHCLSMALQPFVGP
jgi:hypothetical protein